MPTATARPTDPTLAAAVRLALAFAAVKLAIHIGSALWQSHHGWGYFRDEFYYIACGRHLSWGYVDHGPLVAVQARLAETIFGRSLAGLRFFSALGGALRTALTGLLCWSLGGRRSAQALAMLAVTTVPIYFALDGFLSMNSWESAFWMTALLALVVLAQGGRAALWWSVFGTSAGLGLLNKPSMVFFLLAIAAALLLTPQRRLLFSRWAAFGVLLLVLITLPNLLWQVHNHWPTLEFLRNGRAANKNVHLAPLPFLLQQWKVLGPWTSLVWIPGLVHLLRQRERRWLGLSFLIFLATMVVLGAKDYYVTPVYPILFAAGGIAWERRFSSRRSVAAGRVFAFPVLMAISVAFAIVAFPITNPVLQPETFIRYEHVTHQVPKESENFKTGPLPQFYADRFGWQEQTDQVQAILQRLSPADRSRVGIFCQNYGEAGALQFLGHGLPPVLSEQNNYWLWGTHGLDGEVMLLITSDKPAQISRYYREIEVVGRLDHPLAMPFEHRNIYLVHGRKLPLAPDWAESKYFF